MSLICRTEWLSNIQIQGFFSRLCLKQRSKLQQESDDATDADDEDHHLMEASASDVDEECLREARNAITTAPDLSSCSNKTVGVCSINKFA